MKFRDTVGRYRPSPKWRSWRPSPSVLVTVVSLLVLTGSVAWASDASVRLTATDPGTGAQRGIGVRYTDDGNGGYDQTVVRADVSVSDDAYVRQIATDANGQQTGINVAYHDTGGGSYVPVVQEVNAQGTPISGGGAGATPTPSCADLGGNCSFTSVNVTGGQDNVSLNVAGVQPTPGSGLDAQDTVDVVGATGGNKTTTGGAAGRGGYVNVASGDGGTGTTGDVTGGQAGNIFIAGGQGGRGKGTSGGGSGSSTYLVTGAGGDGDHAGGSNGGPGGYTQLGVSYGGEAYGTGNAGEGGDTVVGRGDGGIAHGSGTGGNGGDTEIDSGHGGMSATGTPGANGDIILNIGNPQFTATPNAGGGSVKVQGGPILSNGKTVVTSGGDLSLAGCVVGTATPVAGSVLTASSATACSFVTPSSGATAVPTATPAPPTAQQNYCGASVTSVITTTHYVSVNCGANSTTESAVQIAVPSSTTAQNLYITTQATEGASGNLSVTLRKNGVDTTLKVTVNANSAAGNYSDTTHTVSLAAGDLIDFSTIDSGNATSAPWTAAMTFANGVATGTCVLTSATPVAGTFLFAQAGNSCVWSAPTPVPTATLVATATPKATATPEIHGAVSQNTPVTGSVLYFPGPQPTPGVYTALSSLALSSKQFVSTNVVGGQGGFCSGGASGLQITANGIVYLSVPPGNTCASGDTNQRNVMPYAATASLLTVHTGNGISQPGSGALVCTFRVGPVGGAIANTTIIATVPAGGAPGSYQDTTHTASLGAGDTYDVTCHNTTNSASSAYIQAISLAFTPS